MSVQATIPSAILVRDDAERGHKIRLLLAWLVALALVLVIAGYGYNYYTLGSADRPFSAKHDALKPSGTVGIKLGMFGVLLFFLIYLYPLRKKWNWLARRGNSRHWLDFHIVLGTLAPIIIAFHASFKFGNIAGMAFFSMLCVTLSGFVGRYLYSQIPRNLSAAELNMKELNDREEALRKDLAEQQAIFGFSVEALYVLPTQAQVAKSSLFGSFVSMLLLDFKRPLRASRVRLQQLGFGRWVFTGFGLFSSGDAKLERAIKVAQQQNSLRKHVLFLSRTQRVFHLWHVIHRPFSYAFAILAVVHIAIVLLMGYRV